MLIALMVPLIVLMRCYLQIGEIRKAWIRDFAVDNGSAYIYGKFDTGVSESDKWQLARLMAGEDLDVTIAGAELWEGARREKVSRLIDPTVTTLFLLDAKIGWEHLGPPLTAAFLLVGVIVWRISKRLMRGPCRVLGWLTEDDFAALCLARFASVERILSICLERFGVDRTRITNIE